MLALLKIKKNIEFNQRLCSVLEIVKNISVAQFHNLENRLNVFESFGQILNTFFDVINLSQIKHPFAQTHEGPCGVVAATSDQGLLGGLNMRVVNAAVQIVNTQGGQLILVGEQGKTYAKYHKVPFVAFPGIKEEQRYQQAYEIRNYLFEELQKGSFSCIKVVYPKSISLVNHRLEVAVLLPISPPQDTKSNTIDPSQIIFESSVEKILEYLAFLWVGQKLGDIFGLSRLAELGARYMHLEESTQRIQELNKKLKLQYFKFRHEAIDQSMRELFATRMLYAD